MSIWNDDDVPWPTEPPDDDGLDQGDTGTRRESMRDQLVTLAQSAFRVGQTTDGRPFIVEHAGANVALFGIAAKRRLAAVAHGHGGKVAGRTALDEAWQVIEGRALAAPKERLPIRVGQHDDGTVVDVGDVEGTAIVVTADGWEVVQRSPITFRRSRAMLPLPLPRRGGTLDELWQVVNIAPAHRHLCAAWLASTLLPAFPHNIVKLGGEQGAAKSTTARIMGQLVDPSAAPVASPPRDEDRWTAAASSRWVLPVDNVSKVPDWWSDELCRAVTGAGTMKRALYTDDDVVVSDVKLCIILNGISLSSAMRSDLAERLIPFALLRPAAYLTEAEVDAHVERIHPTVLGALLDLAVGMLAADGKVTRPRDLRMADAAEAFARYDHHLGLDHGALAAYREHVEEAFAEALDDDVVAQAILRFMAGRDQFDGTAGELLAELNAERAARFDSTAADTYWPTTAGHFMRALPRSGPLLARMGVMWTDLGRGKSGRRVRLWTVPQGDAHGPEGDAHSDLSVTRFPSQSDAGDAGDAHFSYLRFHNGEGVDEGQGRETQQREKSVTSVTERHPSTDRSTASPLADPVLDELTAALPVLDELPLPSDDPWQVTA